GLLGLDQSLQFPVGPADEAPLAVGDGEVKAIDTLKEGGALAVGLEVDPAVIELAGLVVGEGGDGPILIGRDEERGLEQNLKAVTDAEDELLVVAEATQRVAEETGQLVGEDLAGGDVVAVGEPARDGEDLVAVQQGGVLTKAVDVEAVGL